MINTLSTFMAGVLAGTFVVAAWSARDAKPTVPESPAVQALRDAVSDCGKGRVLWQSSRTNEPGVVWYTMRCEVQP